MNKIIKSFLFFVFAVAMLTNAFDIHITSEYFEDNSGRVEITYCVPFGYCD